MIKACTRTTEEENVCRYKCPHVPEMGPDKHAKSVGVQLVQV